MEYLQELYCAVSVMCTVIFFFYIFLDSMKKMIQLQRKDYDYTLKKIHIKVDTIKRKHRWYKSHIDDRVGRITDCVTILRQENITMDDITNEIASMEQELENEYITKNEFQHEISNLLARIKLHD